MDSRVAVGGGGAVGTTAAKTLAHRGAEVVLYERGDLASGASGTGRCTGPCVGSPSGPSRTLYGPVCRVPERAIPDTR
jgi:glycine/D-amino acid oxidase-like deaminating enzyme